MDHGDYESIGHRQNRSIRKYLRVKAIENTVIRLYFLGLVVKALFKLSENVSPSTSILSNFNQGSY